MDEAKFLQELKEIELLKEALGLLEWDSQTGRAPSSNSFRSDVVSYLSEMTFERSIDQRINEAITYFSSQPETLSSLGHEVLAKVKENYDLNNRISTKRMAEYKGKLTHAHLNWLHARKEKNFDEMKDSIQTIVTFLKEFIIDWRKNEATPYDVLLHQYEPGMTVAKLDTIFETVKKGIIEIRKTIAEKGIPPRTDFLFRKMTKNQQKKFVIGIAEQLGYDFDKGRLDDTVHPFMLALNRNDARITTRWDEHNFSMAIFGVIHEVGHGIYEQNIHPKYDYTPLSTGASMGIHESQSLFYEMIIGNHKGFWKKQFPFFKECAEGAFDDLDFETFYAGLKETKASLIRVEADSLTYPLHIIIRYEIEKMIFNENVLLDDLPKIWNEKYKEYLGICPKNDLEGILQDVHWSGGSFGYFPSYALGYMYAAQLFDAMKKELDINTILATGKYQSMTNWLTKNIHQYGASKKPNCLIKEATGEELNPQYLLEYLKSIYFDVYQITQDREQGKNASN